jgi:hypothetical protein
MEMAQEQHKSKIAILAKHQGIGAVICFVAAIRLIRQFEMLETCYLLTSGIFIILYLIIVPSVVLRSIGFMKRINLAKGTYKETLIAYTEGRKQFLLIQKVGIYLNFILLIVSLPVLMKVLSGKDIFMENRRVLYWYIPTMTIFLTVFSRWYYGKYRNVTASASNILADLEDLSH